jgi:hypothetical protein
MVEVLQKEGSIFCATKQNDRGTTRCSILFILCHMFFLAGAMQCVPYVNTVCAILYYLYLAVCAIR